MFVHEKKAKNDESRVYHIRDDFKHHNAQLFLFDFVLNDKLRIKEIVKLMKLSLQHFFLQ